MRQGGHALVETILLGLLLLVPLIWLMGVLGDLHRTALATTTGVRDAGARAARADSLSSASQAIDHAVATALEDHELDPSLARVRWNAATAFDRGGRVEIDVRYPVAIGRAPFLGTVSGPSIWVEARHVVRVHPFISR